ncbi:MAG TPA: MFS transporter [Ignavibacteriales bacterium]|nr:MFS transporter [Ignavibacteriales bacterium]HOL81183.1 MFS transporter [Ignavibacteriales bacterium]HOM65286.1 MFS transporter [Ignavibacteriales bacterium]HPD66578.1 MFS transporter [Ignavibacteriales bacterium]HPP33461.1 MFS transporter [Ignavibacteriales bacterium]
MFTRVIQFLKENFKRSFWVANIMELFERIAYYGQAAVLSVYLRDYLKFNEGLAGSLSSIFGGLLYGLPIFAGAIIDKIGFKKSFLFAFLVLGLGYSSLGLVSNISTSNNLYFIILLILIFTAIGGSFIKPSVLGTVNYTTTEKSKTLGYSIYYWLVNIGGALGPILAYLFRNALGIHTVFLVSGISCLLMFFSTMFFYENPITYANNNSIKIIIDNFIKVIMNIKFLVFLLIFSLFWIMFWQIFIIIPYYIRDFIDINAPFDLITSVGPITIILLQLVISYFTTKLSAEKAIILGFLLSSLSWSIVFFSPSLLTIVLMLFFHSIGEQIQAPKYYEYIANIAPKGQIGLYQGFAFLPIAIGWLFGGTLGGYIYESIKFVSNPKIIFLYVSGIGFLATIFMLIFYKLTKK